MSQRQTIIPGYNDLANYIGASPGSIHSIVSRETGLKAAKVYVGTTDDDPRPMVHFDRERVDRWIRLKQGTRRLSMSELVNWAHRALELLRQYHQELYGTELDLVTSDLFDATRLPKQPAAIDASLELRTAPIWAAAKTLGVPASRIRRWADSGKLRHTRSPGGHRRIVIKDIQALKAEMDRARKVKDLGL